MDKVYGQKLSLPFERLRVRLWKDWMARHSEEPDNLFHYTSRAGLKGILASRRLWATSARHLNDRSEIEYAAGLVDEVMISRQEKPLSRIIRNFLGRAFETYNPYEALYSVFTISFCSAGDDVNLWHRYADSARGYNIGFQTGALARHPRSAIDQRLLRVIYDRLEQLTIIEHIVDGVIGTLEEATAGMWRDTQTDPFIADACLLLRELLADCLIGMKNSHFASEQEWRVFHPCDPREHARRVKHRERNGKDVPYVEIDCGFIGPPWMGRLPVVSVTHGPLQRPREAREEIKALLICPEYEGVQVHRSTVPLQE